MGVGIMSEQGVDIVIGDLGSYYVAIRLLHRCHPDQSDYWDGNWIESEVRVCVGGFHGEYRASLRSEEFAAFRRQLQLLVNTLQGTARFTTMEEQLAVTLRGDGKGHVAVEGTALDQPGEGNRLTFNFEVDQTYLSGILRSIDQMLAEFPVVGSPDF